MRSLFLALLLANLALFGLSRGWFGQAPADRGREPGRMGNQIRPETIQVPKAQGLNSLEPTPAAPASPSVEAPGAATLAQTPTPAAPVPAPAPAQPEVPAPVQPPAPVTSQAEPSPAAPQAAAPAAPAMPATPTVPAITPLAPSPVAPPAPQAQATARPGTRTALLCTEWGGFTDAEFATVRRWAHDHLPNAALDMRHEASKSNWMVVTPVTSEPQAVVAQLTRSGVRDMFVIRDPGPLQNAVSLGLFSSEASAHRRVTELQAIGVQNLHVLPRPVKGTDRIWARLQGTTAADRDQINGARLPFGRRTVRDCQ